MSANVAGCITGGFPRGHDPDWGRKSKEGEMMTTFTDWLNEQMTECGWSVRETARRAGVSHPLIYKIRGGKPPSFESCLKLADVFMSEPTALLRLAGLLPQKPEVDMLSSDFLRLLPLLNERDKRELLYLARIKVKSSE